MGLFTAPEDKIVTAYDVADVPHQRELKNFKFRVSVYGVLKEGKSILVAKNSISKKYGLPGGAVEIGEMIKEALVREFEEETGLLVEVGELLGVSENLFTMGDEDAHNIIIVYFVNKISGEIVVGKLDDEIISVEFVDINHLLNGNIQSIFKDIISTLNI